MRDGISGALCPNGFPFASIINTLSLENEFFPCVTAAIKQNETNLSTDPNEIQIGGDPVTLKLPDGSNAGVGPWQLTSSYPSNWRNPSASCSYAISHFLIPAYSYWKDELQGDDLVRAIAATYNAGLGQAQAGHSEGDLDKYTTDHYAARCLAHFQNLVKGVIA